MHLRKHILILTMLISTSAFAQKIWTLEACIDHAIEHNLQLNDFAFNAESNRETYRQSVRNLLPVVNGFADYSINFGRSINPEDNSFVNTEFFSNNYALQSSFDLFQGFQKLNGIKASKFLYKAAIEENVQQRFLLAFRVMSAYYDILFVEGLLEISREQVDISQTNYDLVEKQVELGVMAGADLYEAESLLLADKLLLTQNENRLKAAKLTLLQTMNIQDETDILLMPELMPLTEVTHEEPIVSDSIFMKAKGFMPSIKAQEFRVKAAKKDLAVARGSLYPSLTLRGSIGTGYFETITDTLGVTIPFRDQFRDNTFKFIGASLNVPIFNAWASRSRIKQQKIALDRAKNNAKIQEQELYQIIQQLVQENNALMVEVTQTEKRAVSQEIAFKIAQKRYEKGMINAIALGQAKNLFATAQNENLQARLRFRVNTTTLDFYKGMSIFNIN
ncbi:TolC family protein [Flagellimonas meishanensis]|uniref:TolC family protein n=1 Tax=Flagellimonas meishanensis TaxID=2873264 RepID=UPI001CA74A65|nr:TolC family protein [[Muricauda] meishanensis]